jgi:transcriptional regulator with XRE-family HTH domain
MEPEINLKSIGERVSKQRRSLGLTQAQLAERADLETVYLSQVERGRKTLSLPALFRLAEALNVGPGWLLDGQEMLESDPLAGEVKRLLRGWTDKQRRALIKALRALTEI